MDAIVQEDGTLLLRAEPSGAGDGRVYVIESTAINAEGGECSGAVTVVVPLSKRSTAVDSHQSGAKPGHGGNGRGDVERISSGRARRRRPEIHWFAFREMRRVLPMH